MCGGACACACAVAVGLRELHDKYKDHPLVTVVMAPHSTYTMHDAGLLKAKKIADG